MTLTPAKLVALVVFLGAVAGATYGVQTLVGDRLEGALLTVEPLHKQVSASPGHDVTFAVKLVNRAGDAREAVVVATGDGVETRSGAITVPAHGEWSTFLRVSVPAAAAPGMLPLDVQVLDASGAVVRSREDLVRVNVLDATTPGFARGDNATITYTGRIADTGNVFESNDPALRGQPFGRTAQFQHGTAPVRVIDPRFSSFPQGLYDGLVGMRPGESRTIEVAPEQAYGPATLETTRPREDTVQRVIEVPLSDLPPMPRAQFDNLIRETGQGQPADFEVGERYYELDPETGNKFHFVITAIDAQNVGRRFDPAVGERFTTVPAWPNATHVVEANETLVTLRVDPPVAVDEPFTFHDYWPGKSAVASMNETEIVIRHSPDPGMSNEVRDPSGQSTRRFTVERLTDDEIILRYPSPNALAGKTLVYHVTLATLQKTA